MNFSKYYNVSRYFFKTYINLYNVRQYPVTNEFVKRPLVQLMRKNIKEKSRLHHKSKVGIGSALLSFNLFKWLNNEEEETPEQKLINTIKRSILCMQREQYDKAEQMLHLALRIAQDLQSKDGITYVYDVMANLAMEREQFVKAEKLFTSVMKRLFADGYEEDNPKILHISSKIAHMAEMAGELEKALQGFTWTLKKIEDNLVKVPNDEDMRELLGLTKYWFGLLLMKQENFNQAKKQFVDAYEILNKIYGNANEEAITLLNNLGVACVKLEDYPEARKYLDMALELIKDLKDNTQEAVVKANMGLVYLSEGLIKEAKELCTAAWKLGRKIENTYAIEQAEHCLDEIKSFINK